MTAIMFLALAVVIAAVGCTALYLRQRTPTSVESGIDTFKREMNALAARDNTSGITPTQGNGRAGVFRRWKR